MIDTHLRELYSCDCQDPEHIFIVDYDSDPDWVDELYISVHLTRQGFWRRLVVGAKYILGRQSRYGAFDEVLLTRKEVTRLRDSLNTFLEIKRNG